MEAPGWNGFDGVDHLFQTLTTPSRISAFSVTTNSTWDNTPNLADARILILSASSYAVMLVSAVVFTILRIIAEKYFIRVAQQYAMTKAEQPRFAESCWKVYFYIISLAFGIYFTLEGELLHDTNNCWNFWPNHTKPAYIDFFYMAELGFYTHSIFAFFTMEQKRSDSWLLLVHHFVTFALIYGSYAVGFERIGILVLITHDFNDIFLELGKTYVYKKNEFMKIACMSTLIVSWMISRLWIFPFRIIYSSIFELPYHLPFDVFAPVISSFILFLCTLLTMHIYWFFLMLRIVYKKLWQGKELEDDREDGIDEAPQDKKKKKST